MPKSEESKEEIFWCISGCITEAVLVEIWLVSFMGEKASTSRRKLPWDSNVVLKMLIVPFCLFWQGKSMIIMWFHHTGFMSD